MKTDLKSEYGLSRPRLKLVSLIFQGPKSHRRTRGRDRNLMEVYRIMVSFYFGEDDFIQ